VYSLKKAGPKYLQVAVVLLLTLNILIAVTLTGQPSTALAYETATSFRYPLDQGRWFLGQAFGTWNSFRSGYHLGEDLVPSDGRAELPIYAPANGIVRHSGFQSGYGFVLVIEHRLPDGTNVCSVLGHLKAADLVPRGAEVIKGQLVGRLSANPLENGGYNFSHLHFGIRSGHYSTIRDSDGGWRYRGYTASTAIKELWYHPTNFVNERALDQPAPLTGSLQVYLSPQSAAEAGAQWRLAGTTTWYNSADVASRVPAGMYTVEFINIPGWDSPANQSVTIQAGQTTTLNINYTPRPSVLLSVAPTALRFGFVRRLSSSSPRSYTVTGSNLTQNVQLQAPSGFLISTGFSGSYSRTVTLQPSNGIVAQRIFVRFLPLQTGFISGRITHSSPGSETRSVLVSGWGH